MSAVPVSSAVPALSSTPSAFDAISLDDKYLIEHGRAYMTGTHALVRLPMLQRQRDLANGLNTAGFISGYRGSPLGGYDQALWKAKKFLKENHIHFTPGVNEELAATAVWGSQQVGLFAGAKYDGVFGIWYGKGPGVDRSGDVFKHANAAGSSKHGGVLLVAGDDHACKSSTLPHQSEHIFDAAMIPVLYPTGVQEILDLGMHGFAMSRYSGLYVAFKCVSDTVDASASVLIDPDNPKIILPDDFPLPANGLYCVGPMHHLSRNCGCSTIKFTLRWLMRESINSIVLPLMPPNHGLALLRRARAIWMFCRRWKIWALMSVTLPRSAYAS